MSFGLRCEYHIDMKACPFCKKPPYLVHVEFDDGDVWYHPECSECNCGWKENYETKEEAVKAWNENIN